MAENDKKDGCCGCESPEQVAYQLMMSLSNLSDAERSEALDLYSECLKAVRGYRQING